MAELLAATKEAEPGQELTTAGIDINEAYELGKVDINFFAAMLLPTIMVSRLPDFYIATFQMLVSRESNQIGKILRFALGLPRGHAKTTFIKIIICWLIVYDKSSFALMVCASEDLAEQLLADIDDMLGSDNCESVYGNWQSVKTTDSKQLKKAMYHGRPVILAAKGAGSAVRGLNIKHTRPDLIFCDDMQTRENDESLAERGKLRRWMVATLFKLLAPRGNRLIIYVGNMYSEDCILYQLQHNTSWISLITGAILDNGEPLWPELHSLEELMESYFHDEALSEADVWFAEVMNDPISKATSLLGDALPECPYDDKIIHDGVFITIDPAGFKSVSDDNVIVVHGVYEGLGIVLEIDAGIKDPEQIIIRTLQLAMQHGASCIGIEDVGYQQTLKFWMDKYLKAWNIAGIEIVPLNPHGRSKEARIRQFIAELYSSNYYLLSVVRAAFVWQAMKYKLGAKKNKDDILDACAYGLDIRNEFWHLVKNLKTLGKYALEAGVRSHNTPF